MKRQVLAGLGLIALCALAAPLAAQEKGGLDQVPMIPWWAGSNPASTGGTAPWPR